MHPNSQSYINKPLDQIYLQHEREKKRSYGERVLKIEKACFTPVVLSTRGGSGKEADRHHKRITQLIADKRKEIYPEVINHLRTRIRFSLLRSILTAIRGVRGRQRKVESISMVEFSLIEQGGEDF